MKAAFLSRRTVLLLAVLSSCAALWSHPCPTYWSDFAGEIIDARNVLDLGRHHLLFDPGRREPLFTYACALVWIVLPGAKALLVQRLTSTLFGLMTLWLLYLSGKELSGRRAGAAAALLGAVNLGLAASVIDGIRPVTYPPAVLFLLLCTLRANAKPDVRHSMRWGFALALGVFTYKAFWAFVPAAVLSVFFSRIPKGLKPKGLCLGLALFLPAAALLLFDGRVVNHAFNVSVFAQGAAGSGSALAARALDMLGLLFVGGGDRWDLTPPGSALCGVVVLCLAAAGAWKAEGRGLKTLGWFGLFSTLPYLLAAEPHSAKLLGAVVILLLFAGAGVDWMWRAAETFSPDIKRGALALIVVLGCSLFLQTFRPVYAWGAHSSRMFEAAETIRAFSEGKRVVIVPSPEWYDAKTLSVLLEGTDVRVDPGRGPLFPPQGCVMGTDAVAVSQTCVRLGYPPPFVTRELWAMSRAPETPDYRMRPSLAHRRGYATLFGLGRAVVQGEDRVMDLATPLPDTFPKAGMMSLHLVLPVDRPGTYEWREGDKRIVAVYLDGKRARPGKVRLDLGPHDWLVYSMYDGRDNPPGAWTLKRSSGD